MFGSLAVSKIKFMAQQLSQRGIVAAMSGGCVYQVECHDKHGNFKWREVAKNIIPTVGLNDALDKHLKGSSYTAAWYVGLVSGSPTVAAGDTMSSHSGWTEVTAYDESVRQTLTLGSVASGSVDNTASKAQFTISTNGTTVGGAFIVSNSTKGGTSGVLYSVAPFSSDKSGLDDGDVLTVTAVATMASA